MTIHAAISSKVNDIEWSKSLFDLTVNTPALINPHSKPPTACGTTSLKISLGLKGCYTGVAGRRKREGGLGTHLIPLEDILDDWECSWAKRITPDPL